MTQKKPTLLDFAILGLIHQKAQTGYQIRKTFADTAMGNYSSSPGTIYPALNRLQKMDLIEKIQQKGSDKLVFQIKNSGVEILKKWLIKPLEKEDIEKKNHEVLLRFAFMDSLVSLKQKIVFLKSFETLQTEYVHELQTYFDEAAKDMPLHGRLAFEYGIVSGKTTLKWCKKVIKEIQ
ncbi:MAG: PadR family transcriptional regulator [Bacteroidota bacterium]